MVSHREVLHAVLGHRSIHEDYQAELDRLAQAVRYDDACEDREHEAEELEGILVGFHIGGLDKDVWNVAWDGIEEREKEKGKRG